ncbi:MAG: cell division protein PerM [Nocardioides sp.]
MTDLLTAASNRIASPRGADPATRRPLWLSAGFAGLVASGAVLVGLMALGLVGWFASDAGAHGDTRDALRVGADAWLLGHGAHLRLDGATITVVPLGLSIFCVYVAFRLGRWATLTSAPEDLAGAGLAAVVLAGLYGVVAVVTAVLASIGSAETTLGRAFVGGFLVALVGGGAGLLTSSGAGAALSARVPETVRAVLGGALAVVLLFLVAGSTLVVAALLLDLGEAANVLSRLHPDAAGGALYTVVVAGVAPNAALLGGAYLLGPGFAVGTGTIVSPAMVVLGPVPAFPLLAALPPVGPGPAWATALVGVPVLLAAVAGVLVVRRHPDPGLEVGAGRGLAAGVLGGVLVALLVHSAGGSVGPGRMADVGAPFAEVLLAASAALGIGGLIGGVAATWWLRRGMTGPDAGPQVGWGRDPSTEDTIHL